MLRASAEATGQAGELTAVQDPGAAGAVDSAPVLAALVDAVVSGDAESIAEARTAVSGELDAAAAIDAIAVLANFEMMTRIADATGALHDQPDLEAAAATGADRFSSAPD
jgi:hypothetical protein